MTFKRGDLYLGIVQRAQSEGSEQFSDPAYPRPYLIVSDARTQTLGLVVACPLTTKTDKYAEQAAVAPFRVPLTDELVVYEPRKKGERIVPRPNLLLGEQLRVMDVTRLGEKVGTLKPEGMALVEKALSLLLRI